ncbi:MAG: hypothetical protein ACP5O1_04635 [Phycisphaerae bacterium]
MICPSTATIPPFSVDTPGDYGVIGGLHTTRALAFLKVLNQQNLATVMIEGSYCFNAWLSERGTADIYFPALSPEQSWPPSESSVATSTVPLVADSFWTDCDPHETDTPPQQGIYDGQIPMNWSDWHL